MDCVTPPHTPFKGTKQSISVLEQILGKERFDRVVRLADWNG